MISLRDFPYTAYHYDYDSNTNIAYEIPPIIYLHVEHIPEGVAWFFLVFNIAFWLLIYFYLDQVVPNEYGI